VAVSRGARRFGRVAVWRCRKALLNTLRHVRKEWVRRHAQQGVQTDDQRAALPPAPEKFVDAEIFGEIRRQTIERSLSGKGNATCESENTFGYRSPTGGFARRAPASTTRSTASSVPSPALGHDRQTVVSDAGGHDPGERGIGRGAKQRTKP
jgi:hypothetical protein